MSTFFSYPYQPYDTVPFFQMIKGYGFLSVVLVSRSQLVNTEFLTSILFQFNTYHVSFLYYRLQYQNSPLCVTFASEIQTSVCIVKLVLFIRCHLTFCTFYVSDSIFKLKVCKANILHYSEFVLFTSSLHNNCRCWKTNMFHSTSEVCHIFFEILEY